MGEVDRQQDKETCERADQQPFGTMGQTGLLSYGCSKCGAGMASFGGGFPGLKSTARVDGFQKMESMAVTKARLQFGGHHL